MGYSTVVVIHNDHIGLPNRSLERLDEAARSWRVRDRFPMSMNFGFGVVVSQDHSSAEQVVIVSGNTGQRADEARTIGWHAIHQMVACLQRHGYTVTKSRRKKELA